MENLWPGAYNFKLDLGTILKAIKEQSEILLEKIDKADAITAG